MKLDDIDIEIKCTCRLRHKSKPSTIDVIALNQEEIRINYYLNHLAEEIEKYIKSGKKFDMNFIESNL